MHATMIFAVLTFTVIGEEYYKLILYFYTCILMYTYTSSASSHTFTYIHIIRLSSATQSGLLLVPVDDTGVPV